MFELNQFARAIEIIGQVMREGAATHPFDDWSLWPHEYHVARAMEHLRLWQAGELSEDHLSHATARLIMALQLRRIS